jgi:hypothetical protein
MAALASSGASRAAATAASSAATQTDKLQNAAGKVESAVEGILEWVGPGSQAGLNRSGDLIIRSADGLRKFRTDIMNPHPHASPHVHLQEFIQWQVGTSCRQPS